MPLTDEDIRFTITTAKRMLIDKQGYLPSSIPPIVVYREVARLLLIHAERELHAIKRGVSCTKPEYQPDPEEVVNLCRDAIRALIPNSKPGQK